LICDIFLKTLDASEEQLKVVQTFWLYHPRQVLEISSFRIIIFIVQ